MTVDMERLDRLRADTLDLLKRHSEMTANPLTWSNGNNMAVPSWGFPELLQLLGWTEWMLDTHRNLSNG